MNKNFNKELLNLGMEKGYLLSPEMLGSDKFNSDFLNLVDTRIITKEKPMVLGTDICVGVENKGISGINWVEFEKSKVLHEKKRNSKPYKTFQGLIYGQEKEKTKDEIKPTPEVLVETNPIVLGGPRHEGVKIINSYDKKPRKWEVKDFTAYFKRRYQFLLKVLQGRQELQSIVSLNRLKTKKEREKVSCIGLVFDKRVSKNGNYVVSLEDPTDTVNLIIKPNLEGAEDLCLDEVIAVKGTMAKDMVIVEEIFFPDIPVTGVLKKSPEEEYVAVISDIHVGSHNFLEKEFLEFIKWLNLESEKNRDIAEKLKYVFVVGDLVAGTGVYPSQEQDLVIKDLKSQYAKLAEYLSKVRKDVTLIICPGNHDATRMAEPQPPLIREFSAPLFELKNAVFVSSPALINIGAKKDFEGFNVLMYHGSSFHYYNNSVNHLRMADARNNPRLTWQYLLKKRHLAPTHGAAVYLPDAEEDGLLISRIPDIVVNGDIHKSDLGSYNGVLIISPSCWERKSVIQERRGNEPDPGRVPFLNLKTREVKFLEFYKQ